MVLTNPKEALFQTKEKTTDKEGTNVQLEEAITQWYAILMAWHIMTWSGKARQLDGWWCRLG